MACSSATCLLVSLAWTRSSAQPPPPGVAAGVLDFDDDVVEGAGMKRADSGRGVWMTFGSDSLTRAVACEACTVARPARRAGRGEWEHSEGGDRVLTVEEGDERL